jgi:hypothetical protein
MRALFCGASSASGEPDVLEQHAAVRRGVAALCHRPTYPWTYDHPQMAIAAASRRLLRLTHGPIHRSKRISSPMTRERRRLEHYANTNVIAAAAASSRLRSSAHTRRLTEREGQ